MVLESTVICADSSEYMRNGDFLPSRMQAQQEAVSMVIHSKTRSNPENNVALMTMSDTPQVLTTLTSDAGRILSKLHQVQPKGCTNFITSIRIAHLALKHRQGKMHKMRIVVFVGSPLDEVDEKELIKLAKRLKKEKVNVDIINFGEIEANKQKLETFIETINGSKDGGGSNIMHISSTETQLSHLLGTSPIIRGEDGTGAVITGAYDAFDPEMDPELALALRVSMEENRAQAARNVDAAAQEGVGSGGNAAPASAEEAQLEEALRASQLSGQSTQAPAGMPQLDPSRLAFMTEEEQIAYALQMSLQQEAAAAEAESAGNQSANPANPAPGTEAQSPVPMETDDNKEDTEEKK